MQRTNPKKLHNSLLYYLNIKKISNFDNNINSFVPIILVVGYYHLKADQIFFQTIYLGIFQVAVAVAERKQKFAHFQNASTTMSKVI